MCREITPWKFVINSLYVIRDKEPLSLNLDDGCQRYFWRFTEIVSDSLREHLRNVVIFDDRYSIENVLWNDNLFIKIVGQQVAIAERLTDDILENSINKYLDEDIKKSLPALIEKAYVELQSQPC
jgi:hypothetical protein